MTGMRFITGRIAFLSLSRRRQSVESRHGHGLGSPMAWVGLGRVRNS